MADDVLDTRDILVNALTTAGRAAVDLAGGHHEEEAIGWDRRTYPLAVYSARDGSIEIIGDNGPGNPRLQRRRFLVTVEVQIKQDIEIDEDDDFDSGWARRELSRLKVAIEKGLVPHKIGVPIEDIAIIRESGPLYFKPQAGKGVIGARAFVFAVDCMTFEGFPDTLVDETSPTPSFLNSQGFFDE